MVTEERVLQALQKVIDPHMNISIVEMKMIRGIEITNGGEVIVGLTFPCIGCPAWTMMQNDIKEAVSELEGANRVHVEVRWDQPWHKEDLSSSSRERIRSFGYQIFPMD